MRAKTCTVNIRRERFQSIVHLIMSELLLRYITTAAPGMAVAVRDHIARLGLNFVPTTPVPMRRLRGGATISQWLLPRYGGVYARVWLRKTDYPTFAITSSTGAWQLNRPCSHASNKCVGKSQSCMFINGRIYCHAPVGHTST